MSLNFLDVRAVSDVYSERILVEKDILEKFSVLLKKCGGVSELRNPYRTLCRVLRGGTEESDDRGAKFFARPLVGDSCGYLCRDYLLFQIVQEGRAYRILDVVDVRSVVPTDLVAISGINLKSVEFTAHALEQFTKRYRKSLPYPATAALQLLAQTTEEGAIGNEWRVKRFINNRYVEVRYFLNTPWRFVIKEEDDRLVVLTIETTHRR